jgi:hypothetical protein
VVLVVVVEATPYGGSASETYWTLHMQSVLVLVVTAPQLVGAMLVETAHLAHW